MTLEVVGPLALRLLVLRHDRRLHAVLASTMGGTPRMATNLRARDGYGGTTGAKLSGPYSSWQASGLMPGSEGVESVMGFKITMNGRPFNARDFTDQLKRDVLTKTRDHVRRNIEAKLRAVHCPDHPVAAQVTVDMPDLSGGQISATPCCEKVADEVRAILEGESAD